MFKAQFTPAVCAAALSTVFDQAAALLMKFPLEWGVTAAGCAGQICAASGRVTYPRSPREATGYIKCSNSLKLQH